MPDDVVEEGLEYILETAFTEVQSVPVNFEVGLCEDEVLETDGLTDLTELAEADGYDRQQVASDGTDFTEASTGTNDRKVTTKTVTFTATGTWNGALYAFMGTTGDDAGKLICGAALSVERFLVNGDTLQVSFVITLTG